MKPTPDDPRRCQARSSRTKQPCQRWAIPGGRVCPTHGGSTRHIKAKAEERLADLIDPKRALREAARLAYSDVTKLYDANGVLLPMSKWPPDIAAAIKSIETVTRNLVSGDGMQEQVHKVQLWDKPKNVELLFKHLGLLIEKLDVTVSIGHQVASRLVSARKRLRAHAEQRALPPSAVASG